MVTREFLLANGFQFRVWDGSKFPQGEYTKYIGYSKCIRIGYCNFFKWTYDVSNYETHITIHADRQDSISIDTLRKALELTKIELKLIEK